MRLRGILVTVLVSTVVSGVEISAQDRWAVAEERIRRLPQDSFPGLPAPVRQEMERLECLVPQGSDLGHPHNVVAGRFATWNQVDWAFLCSFEGETSMHILWGGGERCDARLGPAPDRAFLQGLGGDSIGFSRRIGVAGRNSMLAYARSFDGPPVPAVWHDGIEDYFEGKASSIYLCVDGEWIRLQGMD